MTFTLLTQCEGFADDDPERLVWKWVDLRTDREHCGRCGNSCRATPTGPACDTANLYCADGKCAEWAHCPGYASGIIPCGAHCIDPRTDPLNCGGCGPCVAGLTNYRDDHSVEHVCTLDKPHCCDAKCVNETMDPENCGGCGIRCDIPHGKSTCINSKCILVACSPGYADCNQVFGDGCEVQLGSDDNNCGICGNACRGQTCCRDGSCVVVDESQCIPGQHWDAGECGCVCDLSSAPCGNECCEWGRPCCKASWGGLGLSLYACCEGGSGCCPNGECPDRNGHCCAFGGDPNPAGAVCCGTDYGDGYCPAGKTCVLGLGGWWCR